MGKTITIEDSVIIPANQMDVFNAYVDSTLHSEFTGSEASIDPKVGGKFEAWDGYITGKFLELDPGKKIVQEWVSTDFPRDAAPSRLEISLRARKAGTELKMIHSGVPEEIADGIREGWQDYYWKPLVEYFKSRRTISSKK